MSSVERLAHPLLEASFLRFEFNVFQYSGPTFHEHQHVLGNVLHLCCLQTGVNSWSVLHLSSYPMKDQIEV